MQQPLLQNTTTPSDTKSDDFNIKDLLFRYLIYWKWFVLSVIICSALAYLFLRYKEVYYGVNAAILIKDEKKGGTSEFSAFSDLNIFAGKNNIENEIAILKSRGISQNVVKKLDLDISYFSEGRVVAKELYRDSPIKMVFVKKNESYDARSQSWRVRVLDSKTFELSQPDLSQSQRYRFGQLIPSPIGTFFIQIKSFPVNKPMSDILIVKSSVEAKANALRASLGVMSQEKTNIVNLSFTDLTQERGLDYLNGLIEQYNEDAVRDRNQVAEFTKEFINRRLEIITKELGGR